MTDPVSLVRQSVALAAQRRKSEADALLAPRRVAAAMIQQKIEKELADSGSNVTSPAMQALIRNFLDMYMLIAWPLDKFPDWQDDGLPHENGADFFSEWMDYAQKTLRNISPGLGK